MLTQDDLYKIGTVVDEKLKNELGPIKKELKKQGKDIKQIKRSLGTAIDYFDKIDVRNNRVIDRIKKHINLPTE